MWALGSRTWTLGLTALALILLLLYGRLAAQLSQLHPATLQLTTARRLSPNLDVSGGGWGGGPGEGAQSLLASGGGGAFSLGADFDPSRAVIIYNRVPKTGSTTFIGLAYDLCATNGFHVLHVNTTKNSPTLSLTDQVRFVSNVTNWDQKKPAIYHGHIAFLDFSRFGVLRQPLYINILREPLERLVSYYYFIRYGDDLRPHLVRKRMGNKMTFDECVARQHVDCSAQHLWLQVPFFCGHHADCWEAGNPWALEEAKRNLAHHYFLVGVTDQMEDFVALMEFAFPSLFRGASRLYRTGKKSHLRKTAQKFLPSEETIAKIQSTKGRRGGVADLMKQPCCGCAVSCDTASDHPGQWGRCRDDPSSRRFGSSNTSFTSLRNVSSSGHGGERSRRLATVVLTAVWSTVDRISTLRRSSQARRSNSGSFGHLIQHCHPPRPPCLRVLSSSWSP
ncbi:heparan sulfate 2-O-sulfotransferase isoform X2 [Oratosquilla oratoria]|uniref:heparan sulfate 2-O-sulfotransferase isoform X2 n=1 Tax=Oratosquilla oratoria TaxID=337810 RepID=UPI003F766EED